MYEYNNFGGGVFSNDKGINSSGVPLEELPVKSKPTNERVILIQSSRYSEHSCFKYKGKWNIVIQVASQPGGFVEVYDLYVVESPLTEPYMCFDVLGAPISIRVPQNLN